MSLAGARSSGGAALSGKWYDSCLVKVVELEAGYQLFELFGGMGELLGLRAHLFDLRAHLLRTGRDVVGGSALLFGNRGDGPDRTGDRAGLGRHLRARAELSSTTALMDRMASVTLRAPLAICCEEPAISPT